MKKILTLLGCLWVGAVLLAAPVKPAAQPTEKPLLIRTQDEWNIAAFYRPAAEPEQKTVLLLHDIGKDHTAFAAFAEKIAEKGMGYLALDFRGHGGSTKYGSAQEPVLYNSFAKEGVDNDYNKMTRDVDAAMEYLKSQVRWEEA